ncbi:right-handed parallel beta-helix repeat-containing protein [Agaribacter marinus]|uniref:right-handed parallel beta-helix repeat-containing protein n=1 Tax=Agaribacter marinus TaxID=1431249 RepID=UPI0024E0E991|nr:right-handed parallel beta-helix repeat-containing protein [Agaribacter marinus]
MFRKRLMGRITPARLCLGVLVAACISGCGVSVTQANNGVANEGNLKQTSTVKRQSINVLDRGITANDRSDSTYKIIEIIEEAKKKGVTKIIFPKGRYDFYPTRAQEHYLFISNNDEGLKRVGFPIEGLDQLEIDGQGSQFIFHGFMNPFLVRDAKGITFKNFSIDFERPFHQEAEILAVDDGSMDLAFGEEFPYEITPAGILQFVGIREIPPGYPIFERLERRKDVEKKYGYQSLLEFDKEKRETAYMVYDLWIGNAVKAEHLPGERRVRIFHPKLSGTVGNIMTFAPSRRDYVGFTLTGSEDVIFDNITIHHAGGMGILGENCHNVTVKNSAVTPSKSRYISTTADATHFVNCSGEINLVNNLFENQKDDATNIHGIYAMVDTILDDKTIDVRVQHPHQYGFEFIDKGDLLELVQGPSMITYGANKVAEVERLSKEITRVKFVDTLDKRFQVGDSVAEVRDYPDVLIKGNIIRRNRARGMLLNCRGKTLVEDNYFHSPGAAILFEGDANFWFEQGGVSDAVIRNNVFDNSVFGVWGNSVLDVAAGISDEYQDKARYNKNILVEGNTFNVYDKGLLLDLFSVDGLIFRNNKIVKTQAYPERQIEKEFFNIEHSDNINIEDNNEFIGFE